MRTWMDVYRQRQRRLREQRFHELEAANRAAWRATSGIEDLAYPDGKRFLFDLLEERAQWPYSVSDIT